MKQNKLSLRKLTIIFGFLAVTLFIFIFFVLLRLKPKMLIYEALSNFEDGLLTAVGFGLLVIFSFYLISLWHFVRYIRNVEEIKPLPLFLIISAVLSLLFIFSDIALLSDIHKQYRNGFSQPEWSLVLPIMIVQFILTILFLYIHITGRLGVDKDHHTALDINIFLIVQYIGIISGLLGLGLASLGFIYSTGWNTTTHGIMGGIVILFPYGLGIMYWLITKFQEEDRQWFDEKQKLDIGKSALLTLAIDTLLLILLFILSIQNVSDVISKLWLPIHLYTVIFLFSLGNLIFSRII